MDFWDNPEEELRFQAYAERLEREGRWVRNEIKIKRKTKKADPIPYEQIAELYNDFAEATKNPQIETLSDSRKRIIKKAWNLDTKHKKPEARTNSLEYFERLFGYAKENVKPGSFLHGDTPRADSHANWRPSFEFVLREETHLGLREGKY